MKGEIITDMLAGRIDPYVVARSKVNSGDTSMASLKAIDMSIIRFLTTGIFSSEELGNTHIISDGSNLVKIAERIARFNYHQTTLITTDKDIIATISFTLFQVLASSFSNLEERQQLFENSYDIIMTRNLGPKTLFRVNYLGTSLYYHLTSANKEYYKQVLLFGLKTLKSAIDPDDVDSNDYCDTLYMVGIALNETGKRNEDKLRQSIELLKECSAMEKYCQDRFLGRVLNSLGYSLLSLGELKQDTSIIEEAIVILKRALPYRVGEREIKTTKTNLETAQKQLKRWLNLAPQVDLRSITSKIDAATRTFSQAMEPGVKESDKTLLLSRGIEYLLDFADTPELKDDFHLQARSELAIGVGLVFNGDSPGAICFLKAALRKFKNINSSDQIPRCTAAIYNLGLAFATLKGLRSESYYASTAIKHFEKAKTLFLEMNQSERAKICEIYIDQLKAKSE